MTGYSDQDLQDERVLSEKRRHRDRPFDVQPVRGSTHDDLDFLFFEKSYLPAAFARDVLDANDRSLEQRLAATKMIVAADTPTPTVLGILVLGHRPRDFSRALIFNSCASPAPRWAIPSSTSS